ncbi:hypothetical protein SAMN05421690_10407 [Nitrosomonas sp. Nm51]|nr:hypothetical protein SAMN05421690_10407 [Nitrosomonas sp. Nm51]
MKRYRLLFIPTGVNFLASEASAPPALARSTAAVLDMSTLLIALAGRHGYAVLSLQLEPNYCYLRNYADGSFARGSCKLLIFQFPGFEQERFFCTVTKIDIARAVFYAHVTLELTIKWL